MDQRVIAGLGLPGPALMELAADGVVRAILQHHAAEARRGVGVVCGPGNNGGDGWVVARRLRALGYPVAVVAHGIPTPGTDAAVMAAVARSAGVVPADPGAPGLWVDALFGTGVSRPLDDAARALVARMGDGAPVVAVDVPSGLCADTGRVWGAAVVATRTVTFAREKLGMWLGAGPERCGVVELVDLGLGVATAPDDLVSAWVVEASDVRAAWPRRVRSDHKGRSHLLVVAGSAAMAGAAVLACRGALAAGAGLVTLAAPDGARPRLGALPPEVMVWSSGPGDHTTQLPDPARFTAVLAGPGLGGGRPLDPALQAALAGWWASSTAPLVFDADALVATGAPGPGPRVFTPHPGEAARLLGRSVPEVEADRLAAAASLATRGVALLKGPHTVISDGGVPSLNPTGNPVLATGGTGDVLSGVVGALLARGVGALTAARLGAWVHGAAGDHLARTRSQGWLASDVATAVPGALEEVLR
jgi:hydroxyethylthiazole kinase-like uncharacterized protein yjeF